MTYDLEHAVPSERACPRCGRPLAADAPEGLCAACLLAAGAESLTYASTDEAPTVSTAAGGGPTGADAVRLAPGEMWGPYRIGRLLGRGGMGEVYEAEHSVTGRRLALKLLRRRLENVDDRARFLREGQLAASVSHPHTVYIFGSEEIAGMPAISMELLPGGTLKDRVVATGPLAPAEAVSAVLDIIGGLDAAQAAGILHRDIKPSNCFIDRDGAVKVGDFGLSISTLARDVRTDAAPEGFEGTPQFAAPEQLRGEPLDVRADIYAVGATLYYLLTGHPPFEAHDLRDLVTRVASEPPRSPRRLRPSIPSGLAAVVLRCLEKSPDRRPASYAALADALRPHSARDVAPARLGTRLMAGVLDAVFMAVLLSIWRGGTTDVTNADPAIQTAGASWMWLVSLSYFLCLEGFFGASLGKRLLGLRVTSTGPGSWSRIVRRTLVFFLPNVVVTLGVLIFGPIPVSGGRPLAANVTLNANDMSELLGSAISLVLTLALFVTARRNNGWASGHDLASGTRVVGRTAAATRRALAPGGQTTGEAASSARETRVGPFTVVSGVSGFDGDTVVAFDPVLRRRVWIRTVRPGTPPLDAARRDVSRIGRLHWLTGRRSDGESWDAFEAPGGGPLLARGREAIGWPTLKPWLLDLAHELDAGTRDGSLPELGLERLWIRTDGHLVLLDFPAPGLEAIASGRAGEHDLTPVALLSAVARFASGGTVSAPDDKAQTPLAARVFLDRLAGPVLPTLGEAHATLARVAATPDRVARRRRAVPIALASMPGAVLAVVALLLMSTLARFLNSPDTELLRWLDQLHGPAPAGSRLADPAIRDAMETYVAGRFGRVLRDDRFWKSRMMQSGLLAEWRRDAAGIAARHPSVEAEALARASAIVAPEIERSRTSRASRTNDFGGAAVIIVTTLLFLTTVVVAGCSLISAVVTPGGVVTRLLGSAVVTRRGTEIGRARSLARTTVAWLPALVWLTYLGSSPKIQGWVPAPGWPATSAVLTFGALLAGAIWTIARPSRGPHDWLAGTRVVPR